MFFVSVLKMRAVSVEVVLTAPHTMPLAFALGAGVVRVPLLTFEALIDARSGGACAFVNHLNTFVVLTTEKDSTT